MFTPYCNYQKASDRLSLCYFRLYPDRIASVKLCDEAIASCKGFCLSAIKLYGAGVGLHTRGMGVYIDTVSRFAGGYYGLGGGMRGYCRCWHLFFVLLLFYLYLIIPYRLYNVKYFISEVTVKFNFLFRDLAWTWEIFLNLRKLNIGVNFLLS
jgi:hypothetical protein